MSSHQQRDIPLRSKRTRTQAGQQQDNESGNLRKQTRLQPHEGLRHAQHESDELENMKKVVSSGAAASTARNKEPDDTGSVRGGGGCRGARGDKTMDDCGCGARSGVIGAETVGSNEVRGPFPPSGVWRYAQPLFEAFAGSAEAERVVCDDGVARDREGAEAVEAAGDDGGPRRGNG